MSVSELSNTRVLLYVNKIYIRENKYLFEIYAIVNKNLAFADKSNQWVKVLEWTVSLNWAKYLQIYQNMHNFFYS